MTLVLRASWGQVEGRMCRVPEYTNAHISARQSQQAVFVWLFVQSLGPRFRHDSYTIKSLLSAVLVTALNLSNPVFSSSATLCVSGLLPLILLFIKSSRFYFLTISRLSLSCHATFNERGQTHTCADLQRSSGVQGGSGGKNRTGLLMHDRLMR